MQRLIVAMIVLASATAHADGEEAPEPLCIYGRARPKCVAIALAEIGLRYGGSTEGSEHSIVFPMDLGILVNRGRSAFGATIGYFVTDRVKTMEDPDSKITGYLVGQLRYRKWLTDRLGFDVALGGGKLGFVGEVAFEFHDLFAITAGVNMLQVDDGHGVAGNVGIRLGAGVIGALISVFTPPSSNSKQ